MDEEMGIGALSSQSEPRTGERAEAVGARPGRAAGAVIALSGDKPLWRIMFAFLIPLMLSNALQSFGQLVGSIALGRWIGVNALAAVSAFFPLLFLLISFVIGISSGSTILIGQAYGAKNEERLKAVIGTTLTFTFFMGVVLAAAGFVFAWPLLRILGTPSNIIAVSVHYARILFVFMPILFLYFSYTTFLRGTGDSKTPFYFLIVSTALTVILLPLLILGLADLPRLGVYGSAYATVIATVVAFASLMVYIGKKGHALRFDRSVSRHLGMDMSILRSLLHLGIPSSVSMILLSVSEIAVISFVNVFGSDATAAYGAVNQVASYVQMPAISIGMTVSIFCAQFIGAGKVERLKSVVRSGLGLNLVIGGILIILIYFFSEAILSLFLTSVRTLDIAHSLLMITLWSYLIFGTSQVFASTMRASGTVFWPMMFSIISIWCFEVPIAYYLSHFTAFGIQGIWVGYPCAFVANLIMQYSYYRFVWQKKQIRRLI